MAYFFDLEDFESTCRAIGSEITYSIKNDNSVNEDDYCTKNKNCDGYKPSQQTVILNDDGSISIFVSDPNSGEKTPIQFGGYCCKNRLPFIMQQANIDIGVFEGVDTTAIYWDAEKQQCRWKAEPEYCALDSFKVILNAVDNDGAMFNVDNDDRQCSLTIDFDYLFKMDCQNLANILDPSMNTNADPKLLADIRNLQNTIEELKVNCSKITSEIEAKSTEFINTNYSIIACGSNDLYCIQEQNDGLTQWQNILGPSRYKRFLDGDPNSYDCNDWYNINNLNNGLLNSNKPPIIVPCETPFGYKSEIKREIDNAIIVGKKCQTRIDDLEVELNQLLLKLDIPSTCSTPIEALETLDVSMTLEVVESDGSLTSVFESVLFPTIGTGNLYTYLKDHPYDSGFYLCGEPNTEEISEGYSGCTVLKYNDGELTGPTAPFSFDCSDRELLGLPADFHCNVTSCRIVKDAFLKGLYEQSGLSTSTDDINTFKASLSKDIFASKWLNFSTFIDDVNILDLIKNKKIKLSLKINNTCANVCIYIDNIKLLRNCLDGNGKSVLITESPGFQLDRIIDNKKSWVRNSERVNRTFDIANNQGGNVIRRTDYDVNDERLVINTKEIDLDINIASAIENDVQCYINDNLDLLDSVPSIECGCEAECYKDVFKIITHAEAVAISPLMPIDPEDYYGKIREMRDAWIKAENEVMLATAPYLDIINGVYHPNPSEDVMEMYLDTQTAYRKAMRELNVASGEGYIEGLIEKPNLVDDGETLVPMVFNTKCGRILKFPSTATQGEGEGAIGNFYIVETPDKQVKIYTTNSDIAPTNTTWIDLSNLIEVDYPSDWYLTGSGGVCTPDKKEFFCKILASTNNYLANRQLSRFHYKTNNNTHVNEWVRPANEAFYMGWDSSRNKCVTNNFKQVIPEEFSMYYPINDITWTINTSGVYQQCYLDIIARNSGSTACTSIDWTWPNIAEDIANTRRAYRDAQIKTDNEYFLSNNTVTYYITVKDPTTNKPVDESGGYIPVKVTTTITKGRGGEIAFQEEYILNDTSAFPLYAKPKHPFGLTRLVIPIGITDPTSYYQNPNGCEANLVASGYGTYITGSTSTMPYPGASANGIDRNWTFYDDIDYYVHLDVVNASTNEVYHVTNNDFNLKDRNLPIKCPSSASTQTFDINGVLNSINTYTDTVMGQIQEDLDWALDACVINCGCEPNCEEDTNTYITFVDFMDDIAAIPTAEEITSVGSGSRCGCDYTSLSTVQQSYTNFNSGMVTDIDNLKYNLYDFYDSLSAYTTSKNIGFCDDVLTQPDLTLISGHTFPNNFYFKGNPYKIKGYTPCKASLLSGWTITNVGAKLSAYTDDITYIKAVSTASQLPSTGNAGEVILVGTPSSYIGYAWDPAVNYWSTNFYNSMSNILNDIEQKRKTFIDAKNELLLAMKPFTWSNNYLPLHSIRLWALPNAPWVSGEQIIDTNGNFSPCPYKITTEACDLLPYCGPYKHVYNNLC